MAGMSAQLRKLVLLPGLDGTGRLFATLRASLGGTFRTEVVRFPTSRSMSDSELLSLVRSSCPTNEAFVIVAESFSSPLAIQYAATKPSQLRGLVICAGFASNPLQGMLRFACPLLSPLLFSVSPPPAFALRLMLVGGSAPRSLVAEVQDAISSVEQPVLRARLNSVLECDARSALAQIDIPMLYIQASHDRLVNPRSLNEIRRSKPDVQFASVRGPHLILQREPRKCAEIIATFVDLLA